MGKIRATLLVFFLLTGSAAGFATEAQNGMPQILRERPEAQPLNNPAWQRRMEILFAEGVLLDEAKRPRGVNKWIKPIEISLRGDAAQDFAPFVESFAQEISPIIGLPIDVYVNQNWAGNVDIFITYREKYWPLFIHAADPSVKVFTCAATPWAMDGLIRRSQIKINAGVIDEGTAKACLIEEFVQSLGLLGEVTSETDTILNDDIGYQAIGPIDILILRVLYDVRIHPGLSVKRANQIAKTVIAEQLAAK